MSEDKRRAVRVDSLNLLYVGIYAGDEIIKHAMGRTLNVSESGILLEMHFPIDTQHNVSISLALEDDLIDIRGEVVYSRPGTDDKHEIGIKFLEVNPDAQQTLNKYIEIFRAQE